MADAPECGPTAPSTSQILDLLACPDCRGSLTPEPGIDALDCTACGTSTPIVSGFPLFPERAPLDRRASASGFAWEREEAPGEHQFWQIARRSPADAYAAFQPFNESGRTILSLVSLLRRALRPGDAILDTWNRTGWTGELLAGLFPEQRIVTLWEGNHGSLGYRGFAYWLGPGRGAPNAHVVFHRPEEPLPFATGAFAMVHGYDSLHRYRQDLWLPEIARVARPEAPIVFPHVHLANGRPTPFFEREGRIRHGREYEPILAGAMDLHRRRVFVMGERRLFEAQDPPVATPLAHDPETTDYNAIVGVLPLEWAGAPLTTAAGPSRPLAEAALVRSPLCRIGLHDGVVSIDDDPEGVAARVLPRHPVYAERLRLRLPPRLEPSERAVLYWAERVPELAGLARRLDLGLEEVGAIVARLEHQELLRVVPIGRGAVRLQAFQGRRETAPLVDEDDLAAVWRGAVAAYGDRPFLIEDDGGRSVTYAETDLLVRAVRGALRASGLSAGDRIAFYAPLHLEAILTFWAAMHEQVTVAILDADWPPALVRDVLERVRPALVFADAARAERVAAETLVVFDEAEDRPPARGRAFSSWLDGLGQEEPPPAAAGGADRPAVVLFTSGTTGAPKGVVLAQHALAHSGRLLARHCGLVAGDIHLGLGELHTMSGLRNPCVAAVQAGAAVVIASRATREQPLAVADCVARWGVTVLSAVPATLQLLLRAQDRAARAPLQSLRRVLCTGTRLPAPVREAFEATFGCPVHDYYGLTETAGLCIGRPPGLEGPARSIGRAVDALLRVVDTGGRDLGPGQAGELLIHSANLMTGYLDDADATRAAFAGPWYRTGDLAVIAPSGDVELVGRCREIVKNSHGEIVPLREIEEALFSCGGIADAGVFVTRGSEEEIVHAVVVPHEGGRAGTAWLEAVRGQLLERLGPRRMPSRLVEREAIPRRGGGAKVPLSELEGWLRDAE